MPTKDPSQEWALEHLALMKKGLRLFPFFATAAAAPLEHLALMKKGLRLMGQFAGGGQNALEHLALMKKGLRLVQGHGKSPGINLNTLP